MSTTGSLAPARALFDMRITSATRCGSRITRSASAAADWPSSRRLFSNCGMTAGARGNRAVRESSDASTASSRASNRRSPSGNTSDRVEAAPRTQSKNASRRSTSMAFSSTVAGSPGRDVTSDAMRAASDGVPRPPNSEPKRCIHPLIIGLRIPADPVIGRRGGNSSLRSHKQETPPGRGFRLVAADSAALLTSSSDGARRRRSGRGPPAAGRSCPSRERGTSSTGWRPRPPDRSGSG